MSLKTAQLLIVLSGLSWAIFPGWGVPVFSAAMVLLAMLILARVRQARRFVAGSRASLAAALSPQALAQVEDSPLHYTWPDDNAACVTTLRMSTLVVMLLAPIFVVRGLFAAESFKALLPAAIFFLSTGRLAQRLDLVGRLEEEDQAQARALHAEATAVIAAKALAGAWAPPRS